jgi:uncharacterized ubiquitin-like protein YukD
MGEKAIVQFQISGDKDQHDLEIPLDITASELICALSKAYSLGVPAESLAECYLKSDNPIALIRGGKTLYAFGVHNGTKLTFDYRR